MDENLCNLFAALLIPDRGDWNRNSPVFYTTQKRSFSALGGENRELGGAGQALQWQEKPLVTGIFGFGISQLLPPSHFCLLSKVLPDFLPQFCLPLKCSLRLLFVVVQDISHISPCLQIPL